MKKVINYLNLNHIGFVELFFAFTFILSGYSISGIPLSPVFWVVLFIITCRNINKQYSSINKPLCVLVIYCLVVLAVKSLFFDTGNLYAYLQQTFTFLCIFSLFATLDFEKFKGAINIVAIISIVGLLWQVKVIAAGGGVHPIEIPGLTMSEERLSTLIDRPCSFFMEPAAFCAFMYVPLLFSLIEKKYIWSACVIVSVLLSGSTTGIVTTFLMVGVYVLTQGLKKRYIILLVVAMIAMAYALLNFEVFQVGVTKIEDTDVETNMRLAQGPYVVSTMQPEEYFFGAPYRTAYNYCMAGRASAVTFYTNEVYMSTFWVMLLIYGVVGLILYLNVYWKLAKASRKVWPLLACLIATLFSAAYSIGGIFVYTTIAMMMIVRNETNDKISAA